MFKRCLSTRIIDHHLILDNLDKRLKINGGSSIEYIFTKPAWWKIRLGSFKEINSSLNPYGHSVIKYSLQNNRNNRNNQNLVMNVCGQKSARLINFFDASQY